MPRGLVEGVVLCRVGEARLAVPCGEVDAIAPLDGPAWDVGLAFGSAAGAVEGKALQCFGQLMRVDSVDVLTTPELTVLPVPSLLTGVADGALTGFVELLGALWPLVSAGHLLEHLRRRAEA